MATTVHAVVRTDNMAGTDVRAQLVSVVYMGDDGATATDIDNGNVVLLDGHVDGEREIYKGITPTASSAIGDIVLLATPEIRYNELEKALEDFYNEAERPARGYHLHSGAYFSVTKDALDGVDEPAVGNVVELAASTKLNVAASATSGSTAVGKIDAVETAGARTWYVVKID